MRSRRTGATNRSIDLQKGWAAALEKYTFLDGNRACALGASYGGYMIYWIAGNWQQPWKCFVDHDGVFDNRMMAYSTEELWFSEWENGGTQWDHPENYEKYNPIDHVKDWRVPMLVMHSAQRLPHSARTGPGGVHGVAAQRHSERVPRIPRRKPLGAEAAEQRALARHSKQMAASVDPMTSQ